MEFTLKMMKFSFKQEDYAKFYEMLHNGGAGPTGEFVLDK